MENDTPEIEDLIADAEKNLLSEEVLKTMKEYRKKKKNIVKIE